MSFFQGYTLPRCSGVKTLSYVQLSICNETYLFIVIRRQLIYQVIKLGGEKIKICIRKGNWKFFCCDYALIYSVRFNLHSISAVCNASNGVQYEKLVCNGGISNFSLLLFIKRRMDVAQIRKALVTGYDLPCHQIFFAFGLFVLALEYLTLYTSSLLLCYEDM